MDEVGGADYWIVAADVQDFGFVNAETMNPMTSDTSGNLLNISKYN